VIKLTFFVHTSVETLSEPTSSALVAMRLIDRTLSVQFGLCFASVDSITMNASLEETRTAYNEDNKSVYDKSIHKLRHRERANIK